VQGEEIVKHLMDASWEGNFSTCWKKGRSGEEKKEIPVPVARKKIKHSRMEGGKVSNSGNKVGSFSLGQRVD